MTFNPNLTQRIVAKAKGRIIPNWRSRLKDYSTIALGLVTTLASSMAVAWVGMPDAWKEEIPKDLILYVACAYMVIGGFGGIGKFLTQPEQNKD